MKEMHVCLGMAKKKEKIITIEQSWMPAGAGKAVWCLLNANNARYLEDIKFCPYCGRRLGNENKD